MIISFYFHHGFEPRNKEIQEILIQIQCLDILPRNMKAVRLKLRSNKYRCNVVIEQFMNIVT